MSAVTKEQVFEAAEALVAAGVTPKVQTVREKIGKGSFSTITEYMREWREGFKAPETPQKEEVIPKAIIDLASSLWSVALGEAAESLEADRQALEQQRVEILEEQREAIAFADNLVEEVERLKEQLSEMKGLLEIERSSHESTRQLMQSTMDELVQYRSDYNASVERISDLKSSLSRCEHQCGKSEEENKKLMKREVEQEGRIARLEAALERKEAEMKHQVDVLVDELEREREKSIQAVKTCEADLEREREKSNLALKASEVDRAAVHAAQIEAATLRGEVEGLKTTIAAAAAKTNKPQGKGGADSKSDQ